MTDSVAALRAGDEQNQSITYPDAEQHTQWAREQPQLEDTSRTEHGTGREALEGLNEIRRITVQISTGRKIEYLVRSTDTCMLRIVRYVTPYSVLVWSTPYSVLGNGF
jgi:hypothetical protein